MSVVKKLPTMLLLSVLLVGCENAPLSVAPKAEFNSSWMHKKKCASCGYVIGLGQGDIQLALTDTTTSPIDTLFVIHADDLGFISSTARLNDVLYFTTNYGDLFAFDLSEPRHPVKSWFYDHGNGGTLSTVRISNRYLEADFTVGPEGYETGRGIATWDIKHDPFNPKLISFTLNPNSSASNPTSQPRKSRF